MRIWSLHPKYLDAKGLVALWRETLLAQHVLEGKTKGYTHHPQLQRFKKIKNPLQGINYYLSIVHKEATRRGYHFDREKIDWNFSRSTVTVTRGQIQYETAHLLKKLKVRDPKRYREMQHEKKFFPHPMFRVVHGGVEEWEIVGNK